MLLAAGRAPQRALPLRCGTFLILREVGAPAERHSVARLEPRLPGGFWQGNRPQRDLFFCTKPHRGRGEGTDRNDLGRAQIPPYPLVTKVAMILSGPASGLFSSSVRIFFQGANSGVRAA